MIFTAESEAEKKLNIAGEILRNGGLVAFPTETVYGLGANAFCEDAVYNIFKAKGRPSDNPLIVHISSKSMISELTACRTKAAELLCDAFMPGPVTLIMKKSEKIGSAVTAGLDTVAIRFPENKVARRLIECAGVPIAAPSANLSGKPSPTEAKHVICDMFGRVDCIIDGGSCSAGVESTVIDVTEEIPVILRPGIVTLSDIRRVVPETIVDEHVLKVLSSNDIPRSPGMKYKHYAPDAEVYVVEGDRQSVYLKIQSLLSEHADKKCGVIEISGKKYNTPMQLSAGEDNIQYAHNLFTKLRECDELGADIVFAEMCIEDDYALTVKNRLYKSAANRVIKA